MYVPWLFPRSICTTAASGHFCANYYDNRPYNNTRVEIGSKLCITIMQQPGNAHIFDQALMIGVVREVRNLGKAADVVETCRKLMKGRSSE